MFSINATDENGNWALFSKQDYFVYIEDKTDPEIITVLASSEHIRRTGTIKVYAEDNFQITSVTLLIQQAGEEEFIIVCEDIGDGWYEATIPTDTMNSDFAYSVRVSDGDQHVSMVGEVDMPEVGVSNWALWMLLVAIGIPAILLVMIPLGPDQSSKS